MLKSIQEPNEIFLFLFSAPLDGRTAVEEDDLFGLHAGEVVIAFAVMQALQPFRQATAAAELVVQLRHGSAAVPAREVQLCQLAFTHALSARVAVEEGYEPDVLRIEEAM